MLMIPFMQASDDNEEQQPPFNDERPERDPAPPHHRHRRWWAVVQSLTLVALLVLAAHHHALLSESPEDDAPVWLVQSEAFQSDPPCNEGGFRVHSGFDLDGNGALDAEERTDTTTLCHGLRGLSGPQGQAGPSGVDAVPQRMNATLVPVGNETCPEGGFRMQTGLDLDLNGGLDAEEVVSDATLCNGARGAGGLNGSHGSNGASALVDKVAAPAYLCADGFVVRFGVDDGEGLDAYNGRLDASEVRESLNFCFEPLRSARVTDLVLGIGNSFTTGCEAAAWMERSEAFVFAGNDGVNGCELHVHRPGSNTTHLIADLNEGGDASPGRDLGLHPLNHGEAVVFDADDGVNGRQLWVSDGTANGTKPLGAVETSLARPWAEGLLVRSTTNQLLWTNGTDLRDWHAAPVWSETVGQNISAQLEGLTNIGEAWLHADERYLWFSAMDANGDVEPHRVDRNGTLTAWAVNDFGSAHLTHLVSYEQDVLASASRGGVKQVLRLYDNGSHAWLTSIAPSSGDTNLGQGMGLHLIGHNLVYDATTVAGEPRLWTTNMANGITVQLSTSLLAPGAQIGVANTGSRLMFDCMTASTGLEVCITDGTPHNSRVLHDLSPGMVSSDLRGLAAVDDGWLFVSDGTVEGSPTGVMLWAVEGESVRPVYDPWPGDGNSSEAMTYGRLVVTPTQAWFVAHNGEHGHEWHRWSHGELSDDWIVIHR